MEEDFSFKVGEDRQQIAPFFDWVLQTCRRTVHDVRIDEFDCNEVEDEEVESWTRCPSSFKWEEWVEGTGVTPPFSDTFPNETTFAWSIITADETKLTEFLRWVLPLLCFNHSASLGWIQTLQTTQWVENMLNNNKWSSKRAKKQIQKFQKLKILKITPLLF